MFDPHSAFVPVIGSNLSKSGRVNSPSFRRRDRWSSWTGCFEAGGANRYRL